MRELTLKQQEMVHAFCVGKEDIRGNKTRAYRTAYNCAKSKDYVVERKAWAEFDKPHIREYIESFKSTLRDKALIDAKWVLDQSVKLHLRCMQEAPVLDALGKPVKDKNGAAVYAFEHAGASKALDLVGKNVNVQAFREQVGVGNPDGTPLKPRTLDDFYTDAES